MKIASGCRIQLVRPPPQTARPTHQHSQQLSSSRTREAPNVNSVISQVSLDHHVWKQARRVRVRQTVASTSHQNSFKLFNSVHHKLGSDLEPS